MADLFDGVVATKSLNPVALPSYVSLGAAAAVAMGVGYYLSQTNDNSKITPLVDPLRQSRVLPVRYVTLCSVFMRLKLWYSLGVDDSTVVPLLMEFKC